MTRLTRGSAKRASAAIHPAPTRAAIRRSKGEIGAQRDASPQEHEQNRELQRGQDGVDPHRGRKIERARRPQCGDDNQDRGARADMGDEHRPGPRADLHESDQRDRGAGHGHCKPGDEEQPGIGRARQLRQRVDEKRQAEQRPEQAEADDRRHERAILPDLPKRPGTHVVRDERGELHGKPNERQDPGIETAPLGPERARDQDRREEADAEREGLRRG